MRFEPFLLTDKQLAFVELDDSDDFVADLAVAAVVGVNVHPVGLMPSTASKPWLELAPLSFILPFKAYFAMVSKVKCPRGTTHS
jgi:hypothetical protein